MRVGLWVGTKVWILLATTCRFGRNLPQQYKGGNARLRGLISVDNLMRHSNAFSRVNILLLIVTVTSLQTCSNPTGTDFPHVTLIGADSW